MCAGDTGLTNVRLFPGLCIVVDIHSVERDVTLIAASAVHGTATRINGSVNIGSIASVGLAPIVPNAARNGSMVTCATYLDIHEFD